MKKLHLSLSPVLFALCFSFALVFSSATLADDETIRTHALAIHGEPKYSANFRRFSYVNPRAPKQGTLRQGAFGTFDSLNQFILQGNPATGLGLIYDTLTQNGFEEPFAVYASLAETIEMPADRDNAMWIIFHINKEARFSDGEDVTAEDVVFTFNALTQMGQPLYRVYYADVESVEALDEHRVRFNFRHSNNNELPLILGQLPVLPQHYWEGKDFTSVSLDPPVGSGPYVIDEVRPGRSISYRRNENYWGAEIPVNVGRHNFDSISYVYYRDFTIMHEAFKSGDIDLKRENQASRWNQGYDFPALNRGEVTKRAFPHSRNQGMQGFAINTRREIFQDPRVRKALNYAFDFEWANKNLFFDTYTRSQSYFSNSELAASGRPSRDELQVLAKYEQQYPEQVAIARNPVEPQPRSDRRGGIRANLRTAISLLDEAGWELDDGRLMKDGRQMTFEILLVQKAFERIVNPYVANLERLGIDASVRLVDTTQYINRARDFDYDMLVISFAQSESPGNEQRDFWSSAAADQQGSRNYAGIKNPLIDAVIEDLINVKSRRELIAHAKVLDRILLAGNYVIPNWHISNDRMAYWNNLSPTRRTPESGVEISSWWSNEP